MTKRKTSTWTFMLHHGQIGHWYNQFLWKLIKRWAVHLSARPFLSVGFLSYIPISPHWVLSDQISEQCYHFTAMPFWSSGDKNLSQIRTSSVSELTLCLRETSGAGSQYRCGRVDRCTHPPSIPSLIPCSLTIPCPLTHTDQHKCNNFNAHFPTFLLDHYGWMDQLTDGQSHS